MNGEKTGGGGKQPNEAYDAWSNMVDEVENQGKEDWTSFECKIKKPENLAIFRENIGRLDGKTRKFLNQLPGNIDQVFGLGKKGTEMCERVQSEIINNTIEGYYTSSMQDNEGNYNLCIGSNGFLYNTKIDAQADSENTTENLEAQNEDMIDRWIMDMDGFGYKALKNFDLNIHKLDEKTKNYLLTLPDNIECVFKKDGAELASYVRSEIENNSIRGRYTPESQTYGKDLYLYLAKDGGLYCDNDAYGQHRLEENIDSKNS